MVSNYEIELIDNGDPSDLKKYLKTLWKKLAESHVTFDEEVRKSIDDDEVSVAE